MDDTYYSSYVLLLERAEFIYFLTVCLDQWFIYVYLVIPPVVYGRQSTRLHSSVCVNILGAHGRTSQGHTLHRSKVQELFSSTFLLVQCTLAKRVI